MAAEALQGRVRLAELVAALSLGIDYNPPTIVFETTTGAITMSSLCQ